MMRRRAPSWQITLADLALILFVTVLAGLAAGRSRDSAREEDTVIAGAQALYRRTPEVSLGQWLGEQQADNRMQLTIFARYAAGERMEMWEEARAMMGEAQQAGYSSRVILEPGTASETYAVLAYDATAQAAMMQLRPASLAR
jgi:hypothetical protein